jgi:very-short-patch-repair endonuclease
MRARQPSSHRSSLLEARAAGMRRNMTESEARLWAELSGSKLGVAFRRQQVLLGRFIVDFLAPAAKVVIEVDGGWHERRQRADARRDRVLAGAGYRVLRFSAQQVLHELGSVIECIRAEIAASSR